MLRNQKYIKEIINLLFDGCGLKLLFFYVNLAQVLLLLNISSKSFSDNYTEVQI